MTTTRSASDTSVAFSLSELTKIEAERVREEDVRRARAREERARTERESEARRRAAEAARVAADADALARRERERAEEKARLEARELARVEVARIEAEAKVRLEADNAARAHEIVVLQARNSGGRRRLQHALVALIGAMLCASSATAYGVSRHVSGLEQEAERLREGQLALSREREQAKATELAALDLRFATLRARLIAGSADEARAAADAARTAVDPKALDQQRLRAFADALDALEARLDTLERIAGLDRRYANLAAWAGERRRGVLAAAKSAGARAKVSGDSTALRGYEVALDELRGALAAPAGGDRQAPPRAEPPPGECKYPGDPLCDLKGRPL